MPNSPEIKRRRTPAEMKALREKLLAHLKAGGSPHEFAEANGFADRSGFCYKLYASLGWEPVLISATEKKLILQRRAKSDAKSNTPRRPV